MYLLNNNPLLSIDGMFFSPVAHPVGVPTCYVRFRRPSVYPWPSTLLQGIGASVGVDQVRDSSICVRMAVANEQERRHKKRNPSPAEGGRRRVLKCAAADLALGFIPFLLPQFIFLKPFRAGRAPTGGRCMVGLGCVAAPI